MHVLYSLFVIHHSDSPKIEGQDLNVFLKFDIKTFLRNELIDISADYGGPKYVFFRIHIHYII